MPDPSPKIDSQSAAQKLARVRDILAAERPSALPAPLRESAETSARAADAAAAPTADAAAPDETATQAPKPEHAGRPTRLALAVLSGAITPLAQVQRSVPHPLVRLGTRLFPAPKRPGDPSRLELAGLGMMLVGAAFLGSTIPGSPVQAQVPPIVLPAPAAGLTAAAAAASDDAGTDAPDTSSSDGASSAATSTPTESGAATPAAATDEDQTNDTDDSSAGGGTTDGRAERVALIVVAGDAPARWSTAAEGSAARARLNTGRLLTGVAQLPGAPLANAVAAVAGQPSTPATRAGCSTPTPVTPATLNAAGVATGDGCDYPAEAASIPGAIARDGRTWKAFVDAPDAAAAARKLCAATDGSIDSQAASSPLAHLGDLTSSGACEASATPLAELGSALKSDTAPAWLYIQIGDCAATPCSDAEATARDTALDSTLATLAATKAPNGGSRQAIVIGDGTATGLAAAPAGSMLAQGADGGAPSPVLSGAFLTGDDAEGGSTDPLATDLFGILRTQASWLGVEAPALGAADGVSPLALPGS